MLRQNMYYRHKEGLRGIAMAHEPYRLAELQSVSLQCPRKWRVRQTTKVLH